MSENRPPPADGRPGRSLDQVGALLASARERARAAAASPVGQELVRNWTLVAAFGVFVLVIVGLFLFDQWTP